MALKIHSIYLIVCAIICLKILTNDHLAVMKLHLQQRYVIAGWQLGVYMYMAYFLYYKISLFNLFIHVQISVYDKMVAIIFGNPWHFYLRQAIPQ